MNVKEAADRLGVNVATVRKLLKDNRISGKKIPVDFWQYQVKNVVAIRPVRYEIIMWEIEESSLEQYKKEHSCKKGRPKMRNYF
jgi:predicted site-specific integrase-resolvase